MRNKLELITNVHMTDSTYTAKVGSINLHPTKSTHWRAYINNENAFDPQECPPRNVLSDIMSKRSRKCVSAE